MGQAQRAHICTIQVVALIAHTRTGQPVLFSRPDYHYHVADYYHPLTFHRFCGIMEEGIFAGAADYKQTTTKMSNSVDKYRNLWYNNGGGVYPRARADYYGRVCLCGRRTGGGHPDYYTYEAGAGSRSISSRSRKQDVMRQQEPDYCQILTYSQIRLRAHAAG